MTNIPFSIPRRQSKIGILLLTLINFGKFLKAAWPLYVLFFIRDKNPGSLVFYIAGTITVFLVMSLVAYLQYRNFSYFINEKSGELVISSGIINRKKVSIEKNKIQEVNINQPLIHRLLNIYKLEVDSPGSDKKEVTVNAISLENARELKEYLMDHQTATLLSTEPAPGAVFNKKVTERITISMASLIKYGLTANYLKSFLGLVGIAIYVGQNALEFIREQSIEEYIVNNGADHVKTALLHQVPVLGIFMLVAVFFILGIIVNLVVNLVIYFGMRITKGEERLSLEYGLLSTKNALISRSKVQMVTEIQNFLQKKVNVLQLRISQISGDENNKDSYNTIPGCSSREKEDILNFVWTRIPHFSNSLKPDFRKLIGGNLSFVVIPITLLFMTGRLDESYIGLVAIYAVVAEVLLIMAFRNSRLYYNEDFISVQSGIWDIQKKTIETEKIQAIKLKQYFWQNKSDLGSATFFTAGGKVTFRSAGYSKLRKLVNHSLYKVESSEKSWM
ncbi:PH domain-containing protein [Marnyiella aurantia]|uniref:PH domain-containing protein n=1 Tax=Marnyiella aurantia TaxID=2758037 RepID=A0A7D7R643_9FLAO|nr:PH domain-containing protein [Marnyiella aurantia]MBA5245935.1 PH domain-containing protein [Marnyiella aurantia]QMS98669.1 PH domain-containing protein [Marnyiella aurantia]